MDLWTKKKWAAESCGGVGMCKYLDSNEARRLARLKNVRSSIRSTMTSHSGWQKEQIEKRRKEQLRHRKQQAKKKPIGEGIKVETSILVDYTTTGLKLKHQLDKSNGRAVFDKKPGVLSSQSQSWKNERVSLPINPVKRCQKPLDAPNKQQRQLLKMKEQLKTLNLSSNTNANQNASKKSAEIVNKRRSFIPKLTDQVHGSKSKFPGVEGEENGVYNPSRPAYLKRFEPKTKLHLSTDITSLKHEHANALKMLQDLDKEEKRRRASGFISRCSSFDSHLSECGRSDKTGSGQNRVYRCEDKYGEIVSSSETFSENNGIDVQAQHTPAVPDESFASLLDGIENASHLSIVLNDDIESQYDLDCSDVDVVLATGDETKLSSKSLASPANVKGDDKEINDQSEDVYADKASFAESYE